MFTPSPLSRRWAALLLVGVVVASTLALATPPAAAHSPHDDVYDLAVSPVFASDRTVVLASRGLLLRSTDGGASWRRLVRGLDNRSQFESVAFSGSGGDDLYAVSGDGAFRSRDGGDSWTRVHTSSAARDLDVVATSPVSTSAAVVASEASGAIITSNGGQSWRSLGASSRAVTAVAYAPSSAQVLLAGDEDGALHVTDDGGQTWTHRSLGDVGAVSSIALSPSFATDRVALIGTDGGGVLRWNASTNQTTPINRGLTDQRVTSVAFSATYPSDDTVFASTWDTGTFVSSDRGATWERAAVGLRKDAQADQPSYADRPHFGPLATTTLDAAGQDPVVFVASFTGVYVSADQAASWQQRVTQSPSIVVGLGVSPDYASDQQVAVASYVNGAFTSSDGGDSWTASNLGLGQPNFWAAGPDRYQHSFQIAISPRVDGRQWLYTASDPGVYRSSDGGATWHLVAVPGYADPRLSTMSVAPRVFVSPTFATDRTVWMVDSGAGDVYRSTDEGATFGKVGHIDQPSGVHCLYAAPTFAADHRLLACTGAGVSVSTDMGATWALTGRLTLRDLAVTVNGSVETWFGATTTGLYRSTNRGQSWGAVSLPAPAGGGAAIQAVAASPPSGAPSTVLVSTKGEGLYRSTDGGTTFAAVGSSLFAANEQLDTYNFRNTGSPIVFSPSFASDRTIFGFSHDRVLRSTDGGSTWQVFTLPRATHGPVFPVIPAAPTIGVPVRGDGSLTVRFAPPPDSGIPTVFRATCRSTTGGVTRSATGGGSPIVVEGLSNGSVYTCRVRATNTLGTSALSAASDPLKPSALPSRPAVAAVDAGPRRTTVSWTVPAWDGGSPITGYEVVPFVGYYPLTPTTVSSPVTTRTITGLQSGVTYRFKVAAVTAEGRGAWSAASPPVTPE